MSYKSKNLNSQSLISKQLNRSTINSSLINISKQLNNISINDVNILKLKNERNKINSKKKSKNKKDTIESKNKNNNKNKNNKNKQFIFKSLLSFDQDFYDINFCFCRAESFSLIAYKYINALNKNDLRKKNYILKENLKFLLNEIKKYKKNEQIYDINQIQEYENKIEYYMNEIKKYKKEIIILKEKYNNAIKENKELQKYIQINKLNNFPAVHFISKTDIDKSITNRPKNIKNIQSFKKINLNLKSYLNKNRNIIKETYSTSTTKASRNNKNIDLSIINNINSNKYLFIDDKNSFQNSKPKMQHINNNIINNSGFIINSKGSNNKNNKNIIINNKTTLQKKVNDNNNNKINQIIFSRIENNKNRKYDNYRTLCKNNLYQNSLKNSSCELNKTINISQSFRYFNDKEIKKLEKRNIYPSKYQNHAYLNNTFNN